MIEHLPNIYDKILYSKVNEIIDVVNKLEKYISFLVDLDKLSKTCTHKHPNGESAVGTDGVKNAICSICGEEK